MLSLFGDNVEYDIANIALAEKGKLRIEWAENQMPVLGLIKKRFEKEKPLKGAVIGACLHVTSETANLVRTLKAGGAECVLCASNPLSTQDDVAASLVEHSKIEVYAVKGEGSEKYYDHIDRVLSSRPNITMDDGGDLVSTLHSKRRELIKDVIAGTEETTTGVIRFKSMEKQNALNIPIIAVNDADTKHLFDNRYGTGQSSIDGILRATNILIAGKNFVVCGYGWCGRGVALRAKGMGANVIVVEVNPLRALEAVMDGYRVMSIADASRIGDIFITATGNKNVIRGEHFAVMKDRVIVTNTGHFNVELNLKELEGLTKSKRKLRECVEEYKLKNDNRIYLLAEGRLINLAAAEGHPASVMDMSFANQALCAEYIEKEGEKLTAKVYPVPKEIDEKIALLKLQSMNIKIDRLTKEQEEYLKSWKIGT
jgi:adenosylhomocysteinase